MSSRTMWQINSIREKFGYSLGGVAFVDPLVGMICDCFLSFIYYNVRVTQYLFIPGCVFSIPQEIK